MVTSGKINTLLVERLQKYRRQCFWNVGGGRARDVAKRKDAVRILENGKQRISRDDYTGKVEQVKRAPNAHLAAGLVPVIAPLAISPRVKRLISMLTGLPPWWRCDQG